MKILLVSATKHEIATLLEKLEAPLYISNHLSRYQTSTHQIDVLVTGVGMVFTTFYLSTILAQEKYDYAINAGVAGAIDKNLQLGEMVHVVEDFFFELGAENNNEWIGMAELGLLSENDLPYTSTGLINKNIPNLPYIHKLKQVKGQTVNKVHGNLQSIERMLTISNAQIESMEGAAFLYCCMHYQLPCTQIRAISNFVEVRNKANWRMKEAIFNLNQFLENCFLL